MTHLTVEVAAAFLGAAAFAVIFRVPRNRLIPAGVAGGVAWAVYALVLHAGLGRFSAGYLGSAMASALSEWGARRLRVPVTLLVVPAIIPLVPGFDAYLAMLAFLKGDNTGGIDTAIKALLVALSIAGGVVSAATVSRMRKPHHLVQQKE